MSRTPDPVYRNALREGLIIGLAWAVATTYCCVYSYLYGYIRPDRPLGPDDVKPVLGMPSWVFWGFVVPWVACGIFTVWFAGFYMVDDDLGSDHTQELDRDIREGGLADE